MRMDANKKKRRGADAMKSFAENPLPPTGRRMKPSHPGEILRDIALPGTTLSISKTAQLLDVSRRHLRRILDAERPVTPEIAARLSALFNTSVGVWLNMQAAHDAWEAEKSLRPQVRRRLAATNKKLTPKAGPEQAQTAAHV